MGADMIISYIYHHKSLEPKEVKEKMLNMVDNLTNDELNTYLINTDEPIISNLDDGSGRTDTILKHKSAIVDAWECIESRHVTWIDFMDYTLYLSGGDSWGDSPTDEEELFSQIWLMDERILNVMDEVNE